LDRPYFIAQRFFASKNHLLSGNIRAGIAGNAQLQIDNNDFKECFLWLVTGSMILNQTNKLLTYRVSNFQE
jgi:hypothetical protein